MKWWKSVIAIGLILGATGITVAGMKDRPPPSVDVQLGKVRKGTITRTVTGGGKVQAATTVKISSNISGDLVELAVKAGDRVQKGQVLGRIDRRRFEASAKQAAAGQSASRADISVAQVEVDRAAAEYDRVEGLAKKGMMSSAELERARADKDGAAARLAAAKERSTQAGALYDEAANNLAKTTLVSPIEGTVIEVSREVGERVRGSDFNEDVVMTIAALAAMEVKLEVGEHEVVHLELGQKAEVRLDALEGQSFEGTVVEIAQKANVKNPGTDAEVTTFPVTVALASRPPAMLPGMNAEVRITATTHQDALIVPIQAVTVRAEKSLPDARTPVEGSTSLAAPKRQETLAKVVFVVDADKRTHPRRVKTGISSDTEYEIVEGVADGDSIVEGPYRTLAKDLKDGDAVKDAQGAGPKAPRS
ncbi:MAG TPA: efflux RND transporter periplasmic adaptor subunit [Myxococcales bacterium]|nr:efflux RND transporter periplasmic adaptor subunit [Myxococcales bacterium]